MILVTGAAGFIGSAVVSKLIKEKRQVRVLVDAASKKTNFPKGVQLDTALTSISDERGVKAALTGITEVIHCASAEWEGSHADLEGVDIQGTATLLNAMRHSQVRRLVYFSHLGSDRASIFPVLKTKAIAEELIRKSSTPYTILRCAAVFGEGDHFISWLVNALRRNPVFFTLPGDGKEIIQPLWIDDLTAITVLVLNDEQKAFKTLPVGGGDYFAFKEIVQKVMKATHIKRLLFPISPAYLRSLSLWFGENSRLFPLNTYWLDYLAADRTCALDALPRYFGILPSRFEHQLSLMKTGEILGKQRR